jgi:hypothetical protein
MLLAKLPKTSSGVMVRDLIACIYPTIVPSGYPVFGVPGSLFEHLSVDLL